MDVTAAMPFSSQSVMTLAEAATGTLNAIQAPIMVATGIERLVAQAIVARMFPSMNYCLPPNDGRTFRPRLSLVVAYDDSKCRLPRPAIGGYRPRAAARRAQPLRIQSYVTDDTVAFRSA